MATTIGDVAEPKKQHRRKALARILKKMFNYLIFTTMQPNVIIVKALFVDSRNQFAWTIENRLSDLQRAKKFVEVLNESPYLRKVEFTEGYNYDYNNLAE